MAELTKTQVKYLGEAGTQQLITNLVGYTDKAVGEEAERALAAEDALQKAIDAAKKSATTIVKASTDEHTAAHLEVDDNVTDNGDTYTLTLKDVASAKALKDLSDLVGEDSVADQISGALDALDLDTVGGTGKVITSVTQTDGQVAATAIDLTATNVAATALGDDYVATNVQDILTELKEAVDAVDEAAISVVAGNGIDVVGASTVKTISVKKATDSEAFLVVDENGIAVKGVQDAIDALEKKIATGGLGGEIDEAFDTIKEIADFLKGNEGAQNLKELLDAINTAVTTEKTRAEAAEGALDTRVTALENLEHAEHTEITASDVNAWFAAATPGD